MSELPDAKYRYVELELHNFKHTLKDLKEMNIDDIETGSMGNLAPYDRFSSTPSYPEGSAVEDIAINRLENKVAAQMLRTVKAIGRMLKRIDDDKDKKKLFNLTFIQKKNYKQVMMKLNISKTTFYRWKDEIVEITAEEMGLLSKITK